MALIQRADRWRRPPTGPVEIDWSHPLAAGLAWYGLGGLLLRDPYSTLTGAATPDSVLDAEALAFSTGTNYVDLGVSYAAPTIAASGFFVSRIDSLSTNLALFGSNGNAANYAGHGCYINTSGNVGIICGNNTGTSTGNRRQAYSPNGTAVAGDIAKVGYIFRGLADASILYNGVFQTPTYEGSAASYASTTATSKVNANVTNNGQQSWVMGAWWHRALSEEELMAFSENPYQILRPRRLFIRWASDGVASSGGTTAVAGVGAMQGTVGGSATTAATSTISAVGGGVKASPFTSSGTASSSVVGRKIAQVTATATATAASSFVLGGIKSGGAASTGVSTSVAVSSTIEGVYGSVGSTSTAIVGAWDGPSGGDGVSTAASSASAVGRSFAESLASSTATVGGQVVGGSTAYAVFASAAVAASSAQSLVILPMYGNGLMPWQEAPTATAYSAYQSPATGSAAGTSIATGTGSVRGDATAASIATSTVTAAGFGDYTATMVYFSRARPSVRGYSADGRDNRGVGVAQSVATAVSDYSVAAHEVSSVALDEASSYAQAAALAIVQAVAQSEVESFAYSFRGERYDESITGAARPLTGTRDMRVYIGD